MLAQPFLEKQIGVWQLFFAIFFTNLLELTVTESLLCSQI